MQKEIQHPWIEKFKGEQSIPQGKVVTELFWKYYDETNTIQVAEPTDPNNPDANVYNEELIYEGLGQRRSKKIFVYNDHASETLFVIVSHYGTNQFSPERPIYAGEVKEFYNIYSIRLRSALHGHPYRVSEYYIRKV